MDTRNSIFDERSKYTLDWRGRARAIIRGPITCTSARLSPHSRYVSLCYPKSWAFGTICFGCLMNRTEPSGLLAPGIPASGITLFVLAPHIGNGSLKTRMPRMALMQLTAIGRASCKSGTDQAIWYQPRHEVVSYCIWKFVVDDRLAEKPDLRPNLTSLEMTPHNICLRGW
jgi:hypothetical protein